MYHNPKHARRLHTGVETVSKINTNLVDAASTGVESALRLGAMLPTDNSGSSDSATVSGICSKQERRTGSVTLPAAIFPVG
jgi:hypothetical protein